MALIGYARVSTLDQRLDSQLDALKAIGCDQIFTDHASGALVSREGLREALDCVKEGDTLVVWKLDRFGRSLSQLVANINFLRVKKVGFRSLTESISTEDANGRLFLHIFASLAEYEREVIGMRTREGLAAAKRRGQLGGRPSKISVEKLQLARRLLNESMSPEDVSTALKVSKSTLYRHLACERG